MRTRKQLILVFITPALLLYLIFFIGPALGAFYYSFFDWSGFADSASFVGTDNYTELLRDDLFIDSLKNTFIILIIGGMIVFGLAFTFTILLNSGIRGKKFFRTVIFLPNVVAIIALTTLWSVAIYHPRFGILNEMIDKLGLTFLDGILWTAPSTIFAAMTAAMIWVYVGFYMILLMAGIDKIPRDFYEAAKLDGANQIQMFINITLPLLWDVLTVGIILWSINTLKVFEFPFAFTALEPSPKTYTVGVYLYIMGFGNRTPIYRLGYAAAMGVYLLLMVILVVLVLRRVMQRDRIEY